MSEQFTIKGIPAAPGLVKGPVHIVTNLVLEVPAYKIQDFTKELQRLEEARQNSKRELEKLKEKVEIEGNSKDAEIFEAHVMFLDDDSLVSLAQGEIESGINAESSWTKAVDFYAEQLEAIPDETLAARAMDVRDVGNRVLKHLLGLDTSGISLTSPSVIIGKDLTPSDTVSLDKNKTLAFLTAEGGPTSHTAILAKAFGLPAVVGLGEDILSIPNGTFVLVDGNAGTVVVNPESNAVEDFSFREVKANSLQAEALDAAFDAAQTLDGFFVEVVANIGSKEDAIFAKAHGAEGVGLFRTEFLYLHRDSLPTEEEQVQAYQSIFRHFKNQPLVVRTLDIGGDKEIPYLNFPKELNPFLGWRGVRMLDGREDILRTQIRSLLKAGVGTDLRIMVPMVARYEEIHAIKALIHEEMELLSSEGIETAQQIQFGIMVEVPSAAILADRMANVIDFFSIGTNDLTQYTLAVDRTNSHVAHLASSFNPAVLYLIQRTITAAHQAGKWCGMCGEFAGDPLALPVLLGMGLDEFSMSPALVPANKQLIRKLSRKECQLLAKEVLECVSEVEVVSKIKNFLVERNLPI